MEETTFNYSKAIAAATALKAEQSKSFERLLKKHLAAGVEFQRAVDAGESQAAISKAVELSSREVNWSLFLNEWTEEALLAFATKHGIRGITNLVNELKGKKSDGPDYIKSATAAYSHMTKAQRKVFLRSIGLTEEQIAAVLAK